MSLRDGLPSPRKSLVCTVSTAAGDSPVSSKRGSARNLSTVSTVPSNSGARDSLMDSIGDVGTETQNCSFVRRRKAIRDLFRTTAVRTITSGHESNPFSPLPSMNSGLDSMVYSQHHMGVTGCARATSPTEALTIGISPVDPLYPLAFRQLRRTCSRLSLVCQSAPSSVSSVGDACLRLEVGDAIQAGSEIDSDALTTPTASEVSEDSEYIPDRGFDLRSIGFLKHRVRRASN